MKMPEKIIEHVCQRIFLKLRQAELLKPKAPESKIIGRMVRAFQDDLEKERALDQEARQMLEKYRQAIDRGEIDEHKMYQMIRKQLIKEKNMVI